MRAQLVCVLLFLANGGLCFDAGEALEPAEGESLSRLLSLKLDKQSAPFWRPTLLGVCGLMNSLVAQSREVWLKEEEDVTAREHTPEDFSSLQSLCRVLHPRESGPEFLNPHQTEIDSEGTLKRKSPYILKRQLSTSKARRPFILRRSVYY